MTDPAADGSQQYELRHELLRRTDRAVVAEAEADRLRAEVRDVRAELQDARAELDRTRRALDRTRDERDQARRRIRDMRASTTWRVGSLMVKPASRAARRLAR